MKTTPLVLFIATILLLSHISPSVCRPRDMNVFDGHGIKSQLDEVLLKAGDNAVSYLMGEKILSPFSTEGLGHLARTLPLLDSERSDDQTEMFKRSEDPPISIDLTFHLLRNMIEMARIQSQKEQAELNRKYLDEVGK
ncbi:UTS1 protein, partial [Atractosteus spatula]|nr:UTS1 protein [Atractosteus spatula]